MGFSIKSITKPISKAVKAVAKAPDKIIQQTERAVNQVGQYDNKLIASAEKNTETLLAVGTLGASSVIKYGAPIAGSIASQGVQTAMGSYQSLGPEGQALLGLATGIPLPIIPKNPDPIKGASEYTDRKQDYQTQPIITIGGQGSSAPFDISQIMPLLLAGGFGLLIFIFITKRK